MPSSMTPKEVATQLNITKNTVYEMIKRGELNAYRVGRKLRIDEKELNDYKISKKIIETSLQPVAEQNAMDTFIISGQDIIIDIICRYLEKLNTNYKILRSNKGSYNGLFDLYNDKVNVASTHLWDGDTNTYNVTYIKSMLPGTKVVLIPLVTRKQGFYVQKGNPKNILSWEDLKRADIKIVNREKGSGTRILLDEHIRLLNIDSKNLNGYNVEATSHLSIASSVARGLADFGIGIEKAAKQLENIEFIPLQDEKYDLVIKYNDLENPLIKEMIKIIDSENFKSEILALGNYQI